MQADRMLCRLAAVLALVAPATSAPAADPGELTVYVAKKVITMDPGWPEGKAVAVRDGSIVSVGRTLVWCCML